MDKVLRRYLPQALLMVGVLLLAGLAYWALLGVDAADDWTNSQINTLSGESIAIIEGIDKPLQVEAYAREANTAVRQAIVDLIKRYQRHQPNISLTFIDPDDQPQQVRDFSITVDGEMLLTLDSAKANVKSLREQDFTNALYRLSRQGERWLVFITGHGERKPTSSANHDLSLWTDQLKGKGFNIANTNLTETVAVPSNASVAIIASPQLNWLPGEVSHISNYLKAGGNLLWLAEPGDQFGLEGLAEQLGIEIDGATIIDPLARLVGIDNPSFSIVTKYPSHPVVEQFSATTLFPQATGVLTLSDDDAWLRQPLLLSGEQSWLERGDLAGNVRLGDEDLAGPVSIALALARELTLEDGSIKNQRVVVIGDGDFIANQYIGNAGNLELAGRLINWLSADDRLINIPAPDRGDRELDLSLLQSQIIALGFLIIIPALLLLAGGYIWWRRRSA